jgi:hypothetical protein
MLSPEQSGNGPVQPKAPRLPLTLIGQDRLNRPQAHRGSRVEVQPAAPLPQYEKPVNQPDDNTSGLGSTLQPENNARPDPPASCLLT